MSFRTTQASTVFSSRSRLPASAAPQPSKCSASWKAGMSDLASGTKPKSSQWSKWSQRRVSATSNVASCHRVNRSSDFDAALSLKRDFRTSNANPSLATDVLEWTHTVCRKVRMNSLKPKLRSLVRASAASRSSRPSGLPPFRCGCTFVKSFSNAGLNVGTAATTDANARSSGSTRIPAELMRL